MGIRIRNPGKVLFGSARSTSRPYCSGIFALSAGLLQRTLRLTKRYGIADDGICGFCELSS
jgi:hypothetical protein